jgi:hypothetical protein
MKLCLWIFHTLKFGSYGVFCAYGHTFVHDIASVFQFAVYYDFFALARRFLLDQNSWSS